MEQRAKPSLVQNKKREPSTAATHDDKCIRGTRSPVSIFPSPRLSRPIVSNRRQRSRAGLCDTSTVGARAQLDAVTSTCMSMHCAMLLVLSTAAAQHPRRRSAALASDGRAAAASRWTSSRTCCAWQHHLEDRQAHRSEWAQMGAVCAHGSLDVCLPGGAAGFSQPILPDCYSRAGVKGHA